jgi:NADH-quinone oxidoreductase subunit L
MALAGVPLFFSGFWSKDEILHAAHGWSVSHIPFYLGVAGAFLTAFYMTRQMAFWGCSPQWPWFDSFLGGHHAVGFTYEIFKLMIISTIVVILGAGVGMWLYGRKQRRSADEPDALEKLPLGMHTWFAKKYGMDELYELTVIRFNAWAARACAFLDQWIWGGVVAVVSYFTLGLAWLNRAIDEFVINLGFDQGCERVSKGGSLLSRLQGGRVQIYLRVIGVALVVLVLFLIWGGGQ